ncbi:MAG: helix-turn-helix transcriptional regulator [Leptolyngbyaceae cyanobacterium RM2_2_4]|nr:helix-turn-helix transcriptional regulator [Leptolyngbyaceae cyanobacterium SM1_4_3]NJN89326.1 helix-turn-helix transcriptional regulator [Leptolyngbyaceae cyanobacterium SL_5_14]NJO51515.1 helix-turn-helix transcriptional regulator [Leptolyngbyaceae cyanobacterium RM2_2_4]
MTLSIPRMHATADATRLQDIQASLQNYSFSNTCEQTVLPQEVVENLIDGILILTEQKALVYANDCAKRILRQLNQSGTSISLIPREIWHICQTLIDSRHLFPNQYWLIESKVFVDSSVVFNVRARWLKLETLEQPCLLLSICDQYQYIKDVALEESQKFGLTSREKEIWLLHRANYTYKQVALELCITPNTVKKHMKNIYVKQKATFATQ